MKLHYSLEPEVIDGYEVPAEMKKVWNVEMDILEEVMRICNKYNLQLFADGGTMIGCARHKGFIPWDDDIDVGLLQDDYFKFLEAAQKEIKPPFYFYSNATDKKKLIAGSRIRMDGTTACTEDDYAHYTPDRHCGIFVDVVVINYLPESKLKCKWLQLCGYPLNAAAQGYWYLDKLRVAGKKPTLKDHLHRDVLMWDFYKIFYRKFENFQEHRKKYYFAQKTPTSRVGIWGCTDRLKKHHYLAEDYAEAVLMPFGDMMMPMPKGYDRILTMGYGDWRTPKQAKNLHGMVLYDAERSYLETVPELRRKNGDPV